MQNNLPATKTDLEETFSKLLTKKEFSDRIDKLTIELLKLRITILEERTGIAAV